jgi:hypothetical protein
VANLYFLTREDEFSSQPEVTFNTKPGSPAAGDFFKHTTGRGQISRETNAYYRDKDNDFQQASVKNLQIGRQKSKWAIDADLIPSGNAATPTAPDTKNLWKAAMGKVTTLAANSAIAAGSTATIINLTGGGGAATAIRVGGGDLIAVDGGAGVGFEVRRVVSRATDAVTLDRALSGVPTNGATVLCGTTYQFDITQLPSLHFWLWNGVLKYRYGGAVVMAAEVNVNFDGNTPVVTQKFSGEACPEVANADSRPGSPTTSGLPLLPSVGKVWLGTTKLPITGCGMKIQTGLELRNSESDQLSPTAVKRTGNNARYVVEQTLDGFFRDDYQTFYDAARTLTAIDTIMQLGVLAGNIVAWSCPRWQPRADTPDRGQETGLKLSGRSLGVNGDDEISIAFL